MTSVYKPPGERFSSHQPLTPVEDQHQVINGDFKSHSSTWGNATTNTDGELVEDWAADNQILSLNHDPKLPALSIAVDGGEGTTLTSSLLPTGLPGAATRLWWNQYHAPNIDPVECKWMQLSPCKPYLSGDDSTWRRQTGSSTHISSMQSWRTSPPQPDAMTSSWTPYEKPPERTSLVDVEGTMSQAWHPSPSNWSKNTERNTKTIPSQIAPSHSERNWWAPISEERRKAWQTLIESTDLTHNSKKAWSTIRKLCDDPCKPKQHCKTTANQVAHKLLLNGRVPNRQPKVRFDRQRYPDDPGFTRAFTAAELNIGIRVLKNGKAPGLDDIQTELIKQFGPKARNYMATSFFQQLYRD